MNVVGKLTGSLINPSLRARDSCFLDAATAAVALVALAGGGMSSVERERTHNFLRSVEGLTSFDDRLIIRSLEVFVELIRCGGEQGRTQVLKAVSDIADDRERARAVVEIGSAMASAAGTVSPAQREQVEMIAATVGVSAPALTDQAADLDHVRHRPPHVITMASAKGGTGKSTTAVHLVAGLLKLGKSVGSIDLDGAQGTLSRYFANRSALARENGQNLAMPRHRRIKPADSDSRHRVEEAEKAKFRRALTELSDRAYLVIDTPGHDCHLARLGFEYADTLITPLNDSLLDVDILARIDRRKREVLGPSEYCKLVWQENDRRVAQGRRPIDWIVMRNRLGSLETRNNREIQGLLQQLSQRIGFRLEYGLSERVIYRELFLEGLTLLDLLEQPSGGNGYKSRLHAREEINDLLRAIGHHGELDIDPRVRERPGSKPVV
jgi:chromosome partitioning protein